MLNNGGSSISDKSVLSVCMSVSGDDIELTGGFGVALALSAMLADLWKRRLFLSMRRATLVLRLVFGDIARVVTVFLSDCVWGFTVFVCGIV